MSKPCPETLTFVPGDVSPSLSPAEKRKLGPTHRITWETLLDAVGIAEQLGYEDRFDVEEAERAIEAEKALVPAIRELEVLLEQHRSTLLRVRSGPAMKVYRFYRFLRSELDFDPTNDRLAKAVESLQSGVAGKRRAPRKPKETAP